MPLLGDSTLPSEALAWPWRQPTAARTRPPFAPVEPPGASTVTSVTTFASRQPLTRFDLPAQRPTGSFTLVKVLPTSVERNRPEPVAAYTTLGLLGSTTTLK